MACLAPVEFASRHVPFVPPPSALWPDQSTMRAVAPLHAPEGAGGNLHDRQSRHVLLSRLAALLDVPLLAPLSIADARSAGALLVPGEALVEDGQQAGALLGGLVPACFVGTKAIAHRVVDAHAARPALWNMGLADALGAAVLRGYTAFTPADAMQAGLRMLADGPVRVKDVCAKAGLGQTVVRDAAELAEALAPYGADDLAAYGIVLEENLVDVVTFSVGATTVGAQTVSYWGSQALTQDHLGREVYGGSDLFVVPGDLEALAELDLPPALAEAVRCASIFDRAAQAAYPTMRLTRRNYDVIAGTDAAGRARLAVLEQSWRVGGASGAEIAALEAFRSEPGLRSARCATVEVYGRSPVPHGATVYFDGDDPVVGAMVKYAVRLA